MSKFNKIVDEHNAKTTGIAIQGGSDLHDNYMVNFNNGQFGNGSNMIISGPMESTGPGGAISSPKEKDGTMVPVKPIDVIEELGRTPTNWSLNEIDEKIRILEAKRSLINQRQSEVEVDAMLFCMENRKKCLDEYEVSEEKSMTYKAFFEQWDTTNEQKVRDLTDMHKLSFESADIFIPDFPDEAVEMMTSYTKAVESLCDKKPRFFVIAEAKDFSKKYERRDPILLAQSPFGFYYHILGAWDKEMVHLSEL